MYKTALILSLLSVTTAFASDPDTTVVVSATNPAIGITSDSLATVFGSKLATVTAAASGLPWPTQLGDIQVVYITDSALKQQMCALLYVSPSQMNIRIPAGVAAGPATISFPFTGLGPGQGTAALHVVPVTIQKVAPGVFSADGTGTGVAAATAVRVQIPTLFQSPVPVFHCETSGCAATPIDLGVDTPVYLTLYGTGIRNSSAPDNIAVNIGNIRIKPSFVGPNPVIPGLDQINIPLSLNLRGTGLTNVTVTADGVTSNAVQVAIQ